MQQNKEQLDDLKKQFRQRNYMKPFERFAELYVKQIDAYKKDHVTDEARLGGQILELQPSGKRMTCLLCVQGWG
jgi:hypothetical protein